MRPTLPQAEPAVPPPAGGPAPAAASAHLLALRQRLDGSTERVALGEVIDGMGHAGFGLALLLLTLPSMIPIPGPFGMVFGSLIALLSFQILLGARRLSLPGFARRLMLPAEAVGRLLDRGTPYLRRVEGWLKPRRMLVLTGRMARMALALPLLVTAVTLALPIPGGNVLPAAALLAFGLGFMTRDGIAVLAGLAFSLAGVIWGALVVFAGAEMIGWIGTFL